METETGHGLFSNLLLQHVFGTSGSLPAFLLVCLGIKIQDSLRLPKKSTRRQHPVGPRRWEPSSWRLGLPWKVQKMWADLLHKTFASGRFYVVVFCCLKHMLLNSSKMPHLNLFSQPQTYNIKDSSFCLPQTRLKWS